MLTTEQLDALLDAAPSPRHRALWAVQRWSAARITEALALRWRDVNGVIHFRPTSTKTGETRQVATSTRLAQELAIYRQAWAAEHGHEPESDESLFPAKGSTTSPMSRQAADLALRNTCKRLGLEGVSTHSFRRSFATGALRRGTSLPGIQKVTGHRNLSSLALYLEPDPAEVWTAIESA